MHQHAPRRRAALAGSPDRTEGDGGNRKIQIRGGIDDHGVVAAEFEQALAQATGDFLGDLATDRRGTGERDQRDSSVIHQACRKLSTGRDQHLEDRRRLAFLQHTDAQTLHRQCRERRARRGLPHRGVCHRSRRDTRSMPTPRRGS